MGFGMPKFITNSCEVVKEKYYAFKATINSAKEAVKMAKTVFSVVTKMDLSKFEETKDPNDFFDALRTTEGISEAYKKIMSSMDPDTIKAITDIMLKKVVKNAGLDTTPGNEEKLTPVIEGVRKITESLMSTDGDENPFERVLDDMTSQQQPPEDDHPPQTKTEPKGCDDNEFSTRQDTKKESTSTKEPNSGAQEDDGYIPNETFKEILDIDYDKLNKDTKTQSTKNTSTKNKKEEKKGKPLPPLTEMLGKALESKYGPNWKNNVPPFIKNPNAPIPDLGLGLSEESNKSMAMSMSSVLRDLI